MNPVIPQQGRALSPTGRLSACCLLALAVTLPACSRNAPDSNSVVAYCAQDQVYAEPLFREFEKSTGIKVRAVFDSEAVKTVGLANRLLAERSRPRCDVFWGNEEMRTRVLAANGVFRPENGWTSFGARSRRLVFNTNLLAQTSAPASLLDLTNRQWQGKVALAYPHFGTTATHFHALKQLWGETRWLEFCRALQANEPRLLEGNSGVVKSVGRGETTIGLTDSDDIAAGAGAGLPVAALPLSPEMLLLPNTVGLVRGGPSPENARRLFEFLPLTAQRLVEARALEVASPAEAPGPTLKVDWELLLRDFERTTKQLEEIFVR